MGWDGRASKSKKGKTPPGKNGFALPKKRKTAR